MKIKKQILIYITLFITFINILSYSNFAQATNENAQNIEQTATNSQPNFPIYSEAAILMDSNTGKILYGKNENQKQYPASTTKILTAILAIENCQLTDKLTASYNAVMTIPSGYSNAAIQVGETLTVRELLDMFLIHSANEIGNIFAEHISGSIDNFANLMNQKAAEIGCTNTHFTNPSGIHDANHYSTAYDMGLIARYCMQNETFRNVVSKVSCSVEATDKYEKRYFRTTNDLIDPSSQYYYEYAIGVKTGFTSQAKNCLIAASLKDNLELITVSLGAEATSDGRSGRYVDTVNLFNYGFDNYKIQEIATKGSVIQELEIENGTKDTKNLSLLLEKSVSGLVTKNFDLNNLDYSVELNENILAPISEGSVLGKITYNIDGITYSSNLVASHSVEESNLTILIVQIILAIFVLFILSKLLAPKNNKKKKSNKKSKKSNKNKDSIYKFN